MKFFTAIFIIGASTFVDENHFGLTRVGAHNNVNSRRYLKSRSGGGFNYGGYHGHGGPVNESQVVGVMGPSYYEGEPGDGNGYGQGYGHGGGHGYGHGGGHGDGDGDGDFHDSFALEDPCALYALAPDSTELASIMEIFQPRMYCPSLRMMCYSRTRFMFNQTEYCDQVVGSDGIGCAAECESFLTDICNTTALCA